MAGHFTAVSHNSRLRSHGRPKSCHLHGSPSSDHHHSWNGAIFIIGKTFLQLDVCPTGGNRLGLRIDISVCRAAFIRIGGYRNLVEEYPNARPDAVNSSLSMVGCNKPLPDAFVMLREPTDPNLPWIGFLLGQSIVSLWYWAADQVNTFSNAYLLVCPSLVQVINIICFLQMMVQRALSSKSLSHARGGCLVAGYCKFVFLFVTILPGMIGRVLWRSKH